ncbi:MAG: hypothetical protein JXR86_16030 [Spirochaetales bacterium]|nr:hypothetical protein [Spirochaetales bacterium]
MQLTCIEPFYVFHSKDKTGILLLNEEFLFPDIGSFKYQAFSKQNYLHDPVGLNVFTVREILTGSAKANMKELIISSGGISIENPGDYYRYARPRKIRITNHTTSEVVEKELLDTAHPQIVDMGAEGEYEVFLEILSIFPGTESDDPRINFIKAKPW